MKRLHRTVLSLCLSLLLCVTCSSLFSVKASAASTEQFDFAVEIHNYQNNPPEIQYGSGSVLLKSDTSTSPSLTFDMLIPYGLIVFNDVNAYYLLNTVVHSRVKVGINGTVTYYNSNNEILGTQNFARSTGAWRDSSYNIFFNSSVVLGEGLSSRVTRIRFTFNWGEGHNRFETVLLSGAIIHSESDDGSNSIVQAIQYQTSELKDKIDEVLTPEGENNLGEAVDQITDQVQENLGALGFAHDTIENFIGLFNEEPPAPIINVPPLKMKIKGVEHQFFNGYQYDFRSMEDNGLSVLVGAVRTAGTLVLWWAFLQYCLKEFDGFFRR